MGHCKGCWDLIIHIILLSPLAFFQAGDVVKRSIIKPPKCEVIPEERDSEDSKDHVRDKDSAPLLMSSPIPVEIPVPEPPARKTSKHWVRKSEWSKSLGAMDV